MGPIHDGCSTTWQRLLPLLAIIYGHVHNMRAPPEPGNMKAVSTSGEYSASGSSGDPVDLHRLRIEPVQDYAICALDPDRFMLTWNTGAERLKQYTPEEIVGQHFSVFYTLEERAVNRPASILEVART